jgi:hypothetical protein
VNVRSIIAVLGGIVIISFLSQGLEFALVQAFAAVPIQDLNGYYAARNQPAMQAAMVIIAGITGLLAGYLVAKIAGEYELQHAAVAAVAQTGLLVRGFAAEDAAAALPAWVRVATVVMTIGAMLLGALVRARAARLTPAKEVES